MDNHPIPQDVTGFQFKLIGNMTIKQFAYVAFGVIVSVIIYYAPISIFIKIFLIPLFGGGGIIIAFLPVEGRPVDIMFFNFLKALSSPNQFVYQKAGRSFSFNTLPAKTSIPSITKSFTNSSPPIKDKQQQLQVILQNPQSGSQNKLDQKEASFIQSLTSPTAIITPAAPTSAPLPQPQVSDPQPAPVMQSTNQTSNSLSEQEDNLNKELAQTKKDDSSSPKIALLEKQIQTLHFQRQQLEQQLHQLQSQLTGNQPQQQVRNIPKEMTKVAGLPHVSDTPNVVVGIVRDPRGNVLPGMLVEIKDKDGNPVRAFKTNQLGQFASATPLASGTYAIEIDDPKNQHKFDVVQIVASNQILLPFEIVSHDAREELRKELFN